MTETIDFNGLFCDVALPLEWSPSTEACELSPSSELANQNCLKIILSLDDTCQDVSDDVSDIGHELQRLDAKINIILELVVQLVAQNKQLSETVNAKLAPAALQWLTSRTPPEPDQYIHVKIYPDSRYPFPVILPGKVISVLPVSNEYQITLSLCLTDSNCQNLLEKYIFRCHRRHVARAKTLKTN